MALTKLMMEYVSLTNKLRKETRDVQKKQLMYQLQTIDKEMRDIITARGESE